ncbi:MAG: hypothetical protein CMH54_02390 [Myxococcales bacterium]|nr:hypothetical protein [Myxococcales bacterium]
MQVYPLIQQSLLEAYDDLHEMEPGTKLRTMPREPSRPAPAEREAAESAAASRLVRVMAETRAIHELIHSLRTGVPLDDFVESICSWIVKITGADGASVTRTVGENLRCIHAVGALSHLSGRVLKGQGGFTGSVVSSGKAKIIGPQDGQGPSDEGTPDEEKKQSGVIMPIFLDGAVCGTIAVISRSPFVLGKAEVPLLTRFAGLLSLSMDTYRIQRRLKHGEHLIEVGRLAEALSDEIRGPLSEVQANVDMIRMGLVSQPGQQNLQQFEKTMADIAAELTHVSGLVSDLQKLAQNVSDESIVPISVLNEIRRAVVLKRRQIWEVASLEEECPASLPLIEGRTGALSQVLMALLANAAESLDKEHRSRNRIQLEVIATEREVHITVRDNGPGISKDNRDRIFNPCFTTKGIAEHDGMGLTRARGLCQDLKGVVDLDTDTKVGATFHVRLPIYVPASDDD